MILSYFFLHKIIIVLIGVSITLYLMNIKFINDFIDINYPEIFSNLIIRNIQTENPSMYTKSDEEESRLSLVDRVEELGFIPSIDENDQKKAEKILYI